MNLTISASSINLSISMLFCILHILSILTRPNIFLNICISKMCRWFSSFTVKVQFSDACVTTGLIIVLYFFILVFFFKRFNFISFKLAQYALLPFDMFFSSNFYIHFITCIQNVTQVIKIFHNFKGCFSGLWRIKHNDEMYNLYKKLAYENDQNSWTEVTRIYREEGE